MAKSQYQQKGQRRAWILGAGFSRSLGGPLLNDLLSLQSLDDLWHASNPQNDEAKRNAASWATVFWLCQYGLRFPQGLPQQLQGRVTGRALWAHAEEFLEVMDGYKSATEARKARLQAHANEMWQSLDGTGGFFNGKTAMGRAWSPTREIPLGEVATLTPGAVAACANYFCEDLNGLALNGLERGRPYCSWAESLVPNADTIVTFNYDLLAEMTSTKIAQILPSDEDVDAARVPLLKLHGSVDWELDSNKTCRRSDPPPSVSDLLTGNSKPLIGTPGLGKQEIAKRLAPLWDKAEKSIQEADELIFLGYRMPASDAEARRRLVNAMKRCEPDAAVVRLVLGNDANAAERLKAIFEWAGVKHQVEIVPMNVEDFLSVRT